MPRDVPDKAATAFRTIGEVSRDTGLPQHILRYWETRFVQLRPVQRAGNRRYYRPEDTELVRRIDQLLNGDGYTVRGVQQLLAMEGGRGRRSDAPRLSDPPLSGSPAPEPPSPGPPSPGPSSLVPSSLGSPSMRSSIESIRDSLRHALDQDAAERP